MRIVHVTATYPPYYAGTGNVCYHHAHGLAQRGHAVQVITAATPLPPDFVDPPGVTVRRLPALLRVGNAPLLRGMLPLPACDLVHLHYPFYAGAEAVLWAWLRQRVPYVLTYHQDVLLSGMRDLAVRLHHRLIGGRILHGARRVLATSADYARHSRLAPLLRHHPTHPPRVGVLPNGVDVQHFAPRTDTACLRLRYGIPPDAPVLLFVGALDRAHYFKGVAVLLQALARLPNPCVHLLVVGSGDLQPAYARRAAELGMAARVSFCGRVPAADLPTYYSLADLLVLPSTTRGEAFGMVLIEALACATPVIASNLPGVRSVVAHGSDGLLVPPANPHALAQAISVLLSNPARRQAMGARGRAKVQQQYAWQVIIPQLEQIYREVLADAPRP